MPSPVNRYCERLGIPVPSVEDAARRPGITLAQIAAVVLLEHGGPLSIQEIATRLGRADLPPRLARPDLVAALKKAWHGQPPLVRDGDRLAIDLLSSELRSVEFAAGLRPPLVPPPAPVEFRQPGDDEPLSQEDVTAAFGERVLYGYSSIRTAAAILEGWGSPQTLDDIAARLRALTDRAGRIDDRTALAWRTDLVTIDPHGLVHLSPLASHAPAFRRDIRRMAAGRLRASADSRQFSARQSEWTERSDQRERALMASARGARRALVHIVSGGAAPDAAALIDLTHRDVEAFGGRELSTLAARLAEFDFLAGVDLRPSLRALGLDPERWLLAELRPVQKTFRPAERSAPVPVTLPGVVKATTGVAGVPADGATWARRLDSTHRHDVAGTVADEARTLCQFFEYGALHGGVRVSRRPDDRLLPVDWAMRGDPDLHAVLDAAVRAFAAIDVVIGAPPDVADPWTRAIRAEIADLPGPHLVIRTADALQEVAIHDVFAVRVADSAAAAHVRRRHSYPNDARVCQLTVTLDQIQPPIWRRLAVPAWYTLERLHGVLQTALGWTNSHLHLFRFGKECVGTPYEPGDLDESYTRSDRIVRLGAVLDLGHREFVYEYDFGDGWTHSIVVDQVRDPGEGPSLACLDGARACPPEDCGGVHGYQELLDVLFDPMHAEFESSRTWVGPAFDPERFDLRLVNEQLRQW